MKKIFAFCFLLCLFFAYAQSSANSGGQGAGDGTAAEGRGASEERGVKRFTSKDSSLTIKEQKEMERAARRAEKDALRAAKQAEKDLLRAEKRTPRNTSRPPIVVERKEPRPMTPISNQEKTIIRKNGKNQSRQSGIIKIQTVTVNGSLAFFISDYRRAWLPIFETSDLAESTYLSLYIDGSEYRLNRSKHVEYSFALTDYMVEVTYVIPRLAQVKASYTFSEPSDDMVDSLFVTYTVTNLDEERHNFELKSVFNTVLGETHKAHFSTPSMPLVMGELTVYPSAKDNIVISSDGIHSVEFLIYGKDITPPKRMVVASKNTIEESSPAVNFQNGRPFNSVVSYNNSSAGIFWNDVNLERYEEATYNYRIDVALKIGYTASKRDAPAEISDNEYNMRYVQMLIDEIDALTQDDPTLNRERIESLQREINYVLERLRKQQ